jgi:hypothetical protein
LSFLYGLARLGDRNMYGWRLNRNSGKRRGRSGSGLRGGYSGVLDGGCGDCRLNWGRRGRGRPGYSRFGWSRLFGDAGLLFAYSGRSRLHGMRPDNSGCWRRHYNNRPRGGNRARGRPGDHRDAGRPGSNGGRSRGSHHDGRRRSRLGHNFSRLGTGWRRRCGNYRSLRGRGPGRGGNWWRLGAHRGMALPRFLLFLLLVGQNGLEHVTRFGDIGEIDFGLQALRGARRRAAALAAGPSVALKLRANLVRLVVFQRTGVGFAARQAELRQ